MRLSGFQNGFYQGDFYNPFEDGMPIAAGPLTLGSSIGNGSASTSVG